MNETKQFVLNQLDILLSNKKYITKLDILTLKHNLKCFNEFDKNSTYQEWEHIYAR